MKASYEEITIVGSSDGILGVFARLIKYKPDIVNDLPFLSSKILSMNSRVVMIKLARSLVVSAMSRSNSKTTDTI